MLSVYPFVEVDREGVGALMRIGVERGRETKPGLKIGICGEHGGDPASVEFCHEVGFDYVSCSPYRVRSRAWPPRRRRCGRRRTSRGGQWFLLSRAHLRLDYLSEHTYSLTLLSFAASYPRSVRIGAR